MSQNTCDQNEIRQKFIDEELKIISSKIATIKDATLIACVSMQVRVQISRTPTKTLTICFQFPLNYPKELILVELKSKSLPLKFLESAQAVIEANKEQFLRARHQITRFICEYLESNPLCVCAQEIADLRKLLQPNSECGEFVKIKQKLRMLHFRVCSNGYFLEAKLEIDEAYPRSSTSSCIETDFPDLFKRFFSAQSKELARKYVQPSLLKCKKGQKPQPSHCTDFKPQPSLFQVGKFLIETMRRYVLEECAICKQRCFCANAKDVTEDMDSDSFVERVYCSHIFHHRCIDIYMKTPPFKGGKKCPKCDSVIYHDKWRASDQLREERWAHEQAKNRELEEVADFLA